MLSCSCSCGYCGITLGVWRPEFPAMDWSNANEKRKKHPKTKNENEKNPCSLFSYSRVSFVKSINSEVLGEGTNSLDSQLRLAPREGWQNNDSSLRFPPNTNGQIKRWSKLIKPRLRTACACAWTFRTSINSPPLRPHTHTPHSPRHASHRPRSYFLHTERRQVKTE